MKPVYMAPMEEVTGYVYRGVYKNMYEGVDKYFTPFISPTVKRVLKTRELKEVDVERNAGTNTVPQILTADSAMFNETVEYLISLGYREFNLNCGCPSGTVVGKQKGSGMLTDTVFLDKFLEDIFEYREKLLSEYDIKLSVKTRIGFYESDELPGIMKVYNKYPLSELIIHPRTKVEMYGGRPNLDAFKYAYDISKCPVCYNGDINTVEDYEKIINSFPDINAVMIGRGLVANPRLPEQILGKPGMDKKAYKEYHDRLLDSYMENFGGWKDASFKMKEVWAFIDKGIEHGENYDKLLKNVRKAKSYDEYLTATRKIFE